MKATLLLSLLFASSFACESATTVAASVFRTVNGYSVDGDNSAGTISGCGTCITGKDDWITFVPDTTIRVALSTDNNGTDFDTKIALFTGSDCSSLQELDCDDDGGSILSRSSYMEATLDAGTRYYVQFGGFGSSEGNYAFTAKLVPSTGTCTSPQTIKIGAVGSTLGAPNGNPNICPTMGNSNGRAWFSWTAPSSGSWDITTDLPDTNFDTVIGVWSDCLTIIGCDDDSGSGTTSLYRLNATASTEYLIQVGGTTTGQGTFALTVSPTGAASGGSCTTALAWDGISSVSGNTANSPLGASPSCSSSWGSPSRWYSFTAPNDGLWTFSTASANTDFDTLLSVYTGCAAEMTCNDDFSGNTQCGAASLGSCAVTSVTLTAGMTVQILVTGSFGNSGNYTLTATRPDPTYITCNPPTTTTGSAPCGSDVPTMCIPDTACLSECTMTEQCELARCVSSCYYAAPVCAEFAAFYCCYYDFYNSFPFFECYADGYCGRALPPPLTTETVLYEPFTGLCTESNPCSKLNVTQGVTLVLRDSLSCFWNANQTLLGGELIVDFSRVNVDVGTDYTLFCTLQHLGSFQTIQIRGAGCDVASLVFVEDKAYIRLDASCADESSEASQGGNNNSNNNGFSLSLW